MIQISPRLWEVCVSAMGQLTGRRLPAKCLSVGADERSIPVIKLMEADLQV